MVLPGQGREAIVRIAPEIPPGKTPGEKGVLRELLAFEARAGRPVLPAALGGRYTPQMLNLDLVGGVSFEKGCYPGQEIVARAHYLGRVKRRLLPVRITGPDPAAPLPAPGSSLVPASRREGGEAAGELLFALVDPSSAGAERVCLGEVVIRLDAPGGGEPLAVVVAEGPEGVIHAPVLPLPLPYPIPEWAPDPRMGGGRGGLATGGR